MERTAKATACASLAQWTDQPTGDDRAECGRLLIADTTGDELYELDPDGADSQGDRLRALPSGLTIPQAMTVLNWAAAHCRRRRRRVI